MKKWLIKIRKGIVFFLVILVLAIFIRTVLGEPCQVSLNSMEPTIKPGEWLWINKLTYGGRLPARWADIPLINGFTHVKSWRESDAKRDWGYHRIFGFRKPKVGDVAVFNSPENEDLMLVKRIAEIEQRGDTLYYFMLGDNAEVSHDSRFFGWVSERLIIGNFWKR